MSKSENIIGRQDKTMKKSIDDYAASILQYRVELQRLPPQHPDYEKIEDQLSRQKTAWVKKLDFNVRVAQNETIPWTDEELGLITIPMEKKAASGYNQTLVRQWCRTNYVKILNIE